MSVFDSNDYVLSNLDPSYGKIQASLVTQIRSASGITTYSKALTLDECGAHFPGTRSTLEKFEDGIEKDLLTS